MGRTRGKSWPRSCCGWPRASQLEASVRSQWQRLHEERGEPVPAFPARTIDDLGVADPAERLAAGMACFEEINLIQSPPPDSPYFYAGILIAPFLLVAATTGLLYAASYQVEKVVYSHELTVPVPAGQFL